MQPFWDVLWSDTKALALFALPMLLLSLPASGLAALLGAASCGSGFSDRLWIALRRGVWVGTSAAIAISMLVEFSLKVEGFSEGRRALHDAATWQLCLAAPLAAFASAFLAARWHVPNASAERRRHYSLRQLFIAQLIAGLLLGWWAYTRREEISQRRSQLEWVVRDRQAKAIFEPYGWEVHTWPDYDEIALLLPGPPVPRPIRDDTLELVAIHGPVTQLYVISEEVTDAGLKHVARAKFMRRFWIVSDKITDDGVAELSELPRLRYLEIYSPHLTGLSLQRLAKIKSLRYVVLSTSLITPDEEAAFRQARPDVNLRFGSRPN